MGHHVMQPVVGSPQNVVQISGKDFNFVIVKIGPTVGIVIRIPNHKLYRLCRFILIQSGNIRVHFFRNLRHFTSRALRSLVVMHNKMVRFERKPPQFRMIGFSRLCQQGQVPHQEKNCHKPKVILDVFSYPHDFPEFISAIIVYTSFSVKFLRRLVFTHLRFCNRSVSEQTFSHYFTTAIFTRRTAVSPLWFSVASTRATYTPLGTSSTAHPVSLAAPPTPGPSKESSTCPERS